MRIIKTLDQLNCGESFTIISLLAEGTLKNRMEILGFLPGEVVAVLIKSRSIVGPMIVSLSGTKIALRAGEASLIRGF